MQQKRARPPSNMLIRASALSPFSKSSAPKRVGRWRARQGRHCLDEASEGTERQLLPPTGPM